LKNEVTISKAVLPELPPEAVANSLGDRRGAKRQYRVENTNIHIREYQDKFVIHVDREDPRKHPLGHLLRDSPETLAAAGTSFYLTKRYLQQGKREEKLQPESEKNKKLLFGALLGLSGFFVLNGIFGLLKRLLLS
jgi:hypothetical protein